MQQYKTILATVTEGQLTWTYKLEGCQTSSMTYEEDVSDWTDNEIIGLTCNMLSVSKDQRSSIEVVWN